MYSRFLIQQKQNSLPGPQQVAGHFKGTVVWDFLSKAVSPKVPKCSPDSNSKAVLNMYSNVLRYSTFKVLLSYSPLRQILS
jgi:hypothetical protein